ncbi:MAG: 50S ribosomal protein L2 [Nanoarchaeota archaeon]|nr:50S ribosomal protein L2 [Nanoarchaeota archaeon]
MGKNLIQQKRGRGTTRYRAHSFHWKAEIKYRPYDVTEREGMVKGRVVELVDCPGHSAPLAQIRYETGDEVFLPAAFHVRVNDEVAAGAQAPVKACCVIPLKNIPEGTDVYNVEAVPGDGGVFCRTGGSSAKVIGLFQNKIIVQLPSKKRKEFDPNCRATIGIIAGAGHLEKPWLKAGKKHWAKKAVNKLYPRTAGVAMNAVNHPFGSGRGRHAGKPKTPSRFAPPGRKVGKIRARRTGRR